MCQKMLFALAIGVLTLGALSPVWAEEPARNINPWQHCGIGAAIFDENETAAAISNVIWDSGTTAVSSATVSPELCTSSQIDVANYIDATNPALTAELAMGNGEHVSGLLAVAGCEDQAGAVKARMRGSMAGLPADYAQQSHADQAHYTYQALQAAGWQGSSCN